MKKAFRWFINFWIGIWKVVKSMGNLRGVLSLLISWFILSGFGLFIVGIIIQYSSSTQGIGGLTRSTNYFTFKETATNNHTMVIKTLFFIPSSGGTTSVSFGHTFNYPPAVFVTNMKATTSNTVTGVKVSAISTTGASIVTPYRSSTSNGFVGTDEIHAMLIVGY